MPIPQFVTTIQVVKPRIIPSNWWLLQVYLVQEKIISFKNLLKNCSFFVYYYFQEMEAIIDFILIIIIISNNIHIHNNNNFISITKYTSYYCYFLNHKTLVSFFNISLLRFQKFYLFISICVYLLLWKTLYFQLQHQQQFHHQHYQQHHQSPPPLTSQGHPSSTHVLHMQALDPPPPGGSASSGNGNSNRILHQIRKQNQQKYYTYYLWKNSLIWKNKLHYHHIDWY